MERSDVDQASRGSDLRRRYLDFIDRHEVVWELTFAVLAILFVIVGFAEESPVVNGVEVLLTLVFLSEFTTRFVASYDRPRYLRGHWIDLLALIPTTRSLRLLRLIRLLRLVRAFAGMYRAISAVSRLAQHRGLALLITAWAAVMVICSLAMYAAEKGVNDAINSPLDALWWGVTTLTTVGYGDVVPKTGEGRLAAAILMLLGIGLFSAITAIVTSFLLGDSTSRAPADRLRDLEAVRHEGLVTDDEYLERRRVIVGEL